MCVSSWLSEAPPVCTTNQYVRNGLLEKWRQFLDFERSGKGFF